MADGHAALDAADDGVFVGFDALHAGVALVDQSHQQFAIAATQVNDGFARLDDLGDDRVFPTMRRVVFIAALALLGLHGILSLLEQLVKIAVKRTDADLPEEIFKSRQDIQ
jgi:hypothetical protein